MYPTRHFRAAGSRASKSELLLTCAKPSRRTVVNPGHSKCTDWYLWFNVYMVFSCTKVANIAQQGKRVLLFICIWLNQANHLSDSAAMTDYQYMFSTSDRHCKLNQLRWQNMSSHLTNETSYWLMKLPMHLDWAIHNVSDLNIDPHVCFFPTLSQDRARPFPLAQAETCPQRSERPVCARSSHGSRNGYAGCIG